VVSAGIGPDGDTAWGALRFGTATVDWMLSTRSRDLPSTARTAATRCIWVDGEAVCDFSDHSGLHTIMYREILAGRAHRLDDVRDAITLAEQIRDTAGQATQKANGR
jgi:UDP-N-acetyl-2-amino-2-deoxyglucuronate dehydrogenase